MYLPAATIPVPTVRGKLVHMVLRLSWDLILSLCQARLSLVVSLPAHLPTRLRLHRLARLPVSRSRLRSCQQELHLLQSIRPALPLFFGRIRPRSLRRAKLLLRARFLLRAKLLRSARLLTQARLQQANMFLFRIRVRQ